jgi:ATP-dependent DNA helicase RecQ
MRQSRLEPDKDLLSAGLGNLPSALAKLGYSSLRPGQLDPVSTVLGGQDAIVVLPTSFGKSAVFQLPALAHGWRVLVFTPTLSLIHDQVNKLVEKGLAAGALSSFRSQTEIAMTLQAWTNKRLQFLFTVPERMENEAVLRALAVTPPDMLVVDELHILREWEDFRKFHSLKSVVRNNPSIQSVVALSATVTEDAKQSVYENLGIQHAEEIVYNPRRENLHLSRRDEVDDIGLAKDIISLAKKGSGIVYCGTKRRCVEIYEALRLTGKQPNGKDWAGLYYGSDPSLPNDYKEENQRRFLAGDLPVMIATVAFGLGIDKPDIRWVIFDGQCKSMEEYVQCFGRAGRDGLPSEIITYDNPKASGMNRWIVSSSLPGAKDAKAICDALSLSAVGTGVSRLTNKELEEITQVKSGAVASIISFLVRTGALQYVKATNDNVHIKILSSDSSVWWRRFEEAINQLSPVAAERVVSLSALAQRMGVQESSLEGAIRKKVGAGQLTYDKPFAHRELKVLKPLQAIDFSYLVKKRKTAFASLDLAGQIVTETSERQKEMIEAYFEIETNRPPSVEAGEVENK